MVEVTRDERALLIVANLARDEESIINLAIAEDDKEDEKQRKKDRLWQELYQWLDNNAIGVTKTLMKGHYRLIDELVGPDVTSNAFVERLTALAVDPSIKAVDAILVMHGSPNTLYFDNGPIFSSKLGTQIKAKQLEHKLRLLYSTACYGASHASDFVKAGFVTASGAKKICANGPYELPILLATWAAGATYQKAVKVGNNPIFLEAYDSIARLLGLDDVDSTKEIDGKKRTYITSPAQ